MNKFLKIPLLTMGLVSLLVSCSHEYEPDGNGQPLEGGTELAMVSQLVNGEMDGAFTPSLSVIYERQIGKTKWKRPGDSGEYTVGDGGERDFPNPVIFQDSECLIEFMRHVPNPIYRYHLLKVYWEEYCNRARRQYRIFVRAPYEYRSEENLLQIGHMTYGIGFENSKGFELVYHCSDACKEYKKIGVFTPNASCIVDPGLMLVYDSPRQMREDVFKRLKEAFGEEGDLGASVLGSPNIKFEELEKEMTEMSLEFPYWFAENP